MGRGGEKDNSNILRVFCLRAGNLDLRAGERETEGGREGGRERSRRAGNLDLRAGDREREREREADRQTERDRQTDREQHINSTLLA
jgi:hypothetical protein